MRRIVAVTLIGLAAAQWPCPPGPALAADGGIEGTWELVSRELADGSKVVPPKIVGMLTYTRQYRNFNVFWARPDGKPVSLAYIAKYRLTAREYQETPLYWHSNNLGADGESYRIPAGKDRKTPVTRAGRRIEFEVAAEPPVLAFDGASMTATAKDVNGMIQFVDLWKKVR
jgi:hypothetical protein